MLTAFVAVLAITVGEPGDARAVAPIGAHSMLQLNDPPSFMAAMFAQAAAMGAGEIRLDVAPSLIFASSSDAPDFDGLDEVMELSRQYDLPILGDLFTIPAGLADCPTPLIGPAAARCPPEDLSDYGTEIEQIVAHADPTIRDWEVWNEPDNTQFFTGTPQQYAWMLRTAHDAILAVDPSDRVLLGGVSGPSASTWLAQVFATPGADAAQAFNVANVHERAALDTLGTDIADWRGFFADYGFSGPLWVTEHGYPSDPAYQYDPAFLAGPASQAAYLSASIPTLIDAGASEVFVTERDNLGGAFASEGLLGGDVSDPPVAAPTAVAKPAFVAVAALAGCYATAGVDCPQAAPAASASLSVRPTPPGAMTSASVTVADPGTEPELLGAATLTGPASDPFSLASDTCSDRLLEPNETCRLMVRFAPVIGGAALASLEIPSDHGSLTVPVASVAPSVSSLETLTTPRRGFAAPTGNAVGHAQTLWLWLRNPLTAAVRLGGAALSGPEAHRFTVSASSCRHATLAPGGRCRLRVRFLAPRAGVDRSLLSLGGEGTPLRVPLRARAVPGPEVRAWRLVNP